MLTPTLKPSRELCAPQRVSEGSKEVRELQSQVPVQTANLTKETAPCSQPETKNPGSVHQKQALPFLCKIKFSLLFWLQKQLMLWKQKITPNL